METFDQVLIKATVQKDKVRTLAHIIKYLQWKEINFNSKTDFKKPLAGEKR